MKRTCLIVLFTTLSVMLLGTDDSASQTFHGGLRGTVNDVQGVIPGATVTLTNQDGGVARETVSNDAGQYSFPAVDPVCIPSACPLPGSEPPSVPTFASEPSSSSPWTSGWKWAQSRRR